MIRASDYRDFAARHRREADETDLPMVRRQHLRAADKWESLAAETEEIMVGRRA